MKAVRRTTIGLATLVASLGLGTVAIADPSAGVDSALFRASYDANGIFAVEGARLMPKHDISFKLMLGYGNDPINVAVPGIGDGGKDPILHYLTTLDMVFGMSLTDRFAIGLEAGSYRTATGSGYGVRGRYLSGGVVSPRSTGLIALRPLSNIDQSASPNDPSSFLGDGLAGPLDARLGLKYMLYAGPNLAVTAVGSVFLPFGEDQMLLGDRNVVFEPKLAADYRVDRVRATRIVANLAARIRQRAVLQSYDTADPMLTDADSKVFLDVGSEVVASLGGVYEITPRVVAALEAQAFIPLPDTLSYGSCRLENDAPCSTLTSSDYFTGAKHGDFTALVTGGITLRISADVSAQLMIGTAQGGARGDPLRITTGVVWAPQPVGLAVTMGDRDGDGIPDAIDQCPDDPEDKDGFQDEDGCPDPDNDGDGIPDAKDKCPNDPEDKDGFQDEDGCPDPDNDGDGIPDAIDKCPNQAEDKDGFQDEDGCPDDDNDGDGIPDKDDKCPNDPETFNGFEDADGCPDVVGSSGPTELADRIDLKGAKLAFKDAALTAPAKQVLSQIATLIKTRKLTIRVEVHVALGTKSTAAAIVAGEKKKAKALAQKRGAAILEYLIHEGVPQAQIQAVGIGADRPLGAAAPSDPINERVDFIKAQQGAP